jgi:beta-lactamase regulating signal transducer with metallopeptidase domain
MVASWMLYTLVVGALLAGAAVLAERGLRLLGRPVRQVWLVATVLAVAVPLLTALRPSPSTLVTDANAGSVESMMLPLDSSTSLAGLPTLPVLPALDAPLLVAWALLSLALLGALLHGVGVLQGRRREWRRVRVDGHDVLVAADLGPAVIGWRRMQIVLPTWALDLDAEARRLILAHESEHIRHRDPSLLFGGLLAALLMPWNAPIWYLYRRLRLAIELDCDARVVSAGADLARYGEMLLVAGARSNGGRLPALATFAERATRLEDRITALTPEPVRRRGIRAAAAGLVTALVLIAACTIENPLGIDLRDSEHPINLRSELVGPDAWTLASIRLVVRNLAEDQFPGAVARGSIPEEAIAFVILDAEQHLLGLSMHRSRARTGMPSALASLPADQIESIEVVKGPAVGIENLGVIVATVKPGAMLLRRVAPSSTEEIPVELKTVERPAGSYAPAVLLRRQSLEVPETEGEWKELSPTRVPAVLLRRPAGAVREVPVMLRRPPAPR